MGIATLEKLKKKTEIELDYNIIYGSELKVSNLNRRLEGICEQLEYAKSVMNTTSKKQGVE